MTAHGGGPARKIWFSTPSSRAPFELRVARPRCIQPARLAAFIRLGARERYEKQSSFSLSSGPSVTLAHAFIYARGDFFFISLSPSVVLVSFFRTTPHASSRIYLSHWQFSLYYFSRHCPGPCCTYVAPKKSRDKTLCIVIILRRGCKVYPLWRRIFEGCLYFSCLFANIYVCTMSSWSRDYAIE